MIARFGTALGLVLAGPVAAAGLKPASQEELLAGVRSCAAATRADGVDEATLLADGWSKGAMSKDGMSVASDLAFYGKGNLMVITMPVAAAKASVCTITARVADVRAFPQLQAAMTAAYGAPIKDDGKGQQMYMARDRRIVALASTGSRDRPAVRIAVGAVIQEKP